MVNIVKDNLMSLDRFSAPVQLNFNGKSHISSTPGLCLTIAFTALLILFGMQKGRDFLYRRNPLVFESIESGAFTVEDKIDLNALGFKIAWGVGRFGSEEIYDDPDFVKW